MSAETEGVTELDQRTKDELAPPCDRLSVTPGTLIVLEKCEAVAQWAIWNLCPQCGPRPALLRCDVHAQMLLSGALSTCGGCLHTHSTHVTRAVRL